MLNWWRSAVENGLAGYNLSTLPLKTQIKTLKVCSWVWFRCSHTLTDEFPGGPCLGITFDDSSFFADLSYLALNRRLFRQHKKLQVAVYIFGAMCIAWWIGTMLYIAFICSPVDSSLNPLIPGKYFKLQNANIVIGVPNSCIDIIIVTMPIKVIKDLHLPSKQKIILCFVFLWVVCKLSHRVPSLDFRESLSLTEQGWQSLTPFEW